MKRRIAFSLALVGALQPLPAQYAFMDDAGEAVYAAGWSDNDNGNKGSSSFDAWDLLFFVNATTTAASASTVTGAWTGMDIGGRSWIINLPDPSFISMEREFAAVQGQVSRVRMQLTGTATGAQAVIAYLNNGTEALKVIGTVGGVYVIEQGPGLVTTSTTIPADTACVFQLADDSSNQTATLEIIPLSAALPTETIPVTYLNSQTNMNQIVLTPSNNTSTSQSAVVLANQLWVDTTGMLPVEIDSFLVE